MSSATTAMIEVREYAFMLTERLNDRQSEWDAGLYKKQNCAPLFAFCH